MKHETGERDRGSSAHEPDAAAGGEILPAAYQASGASALYKR